MNSVTLVWKVPKSPVEDEEFHERGIYPQGELMGICRTKEDAEKLIDYLEEFSPSDRFGKHENPKNNSMENAPYVFTISNEEVAGYNHD